MDERKGLLLILFFVLFRVIHLINVLNHVDNINESFFDERPKLLKLFIA